MGLIIVAIIFMLLGILIKDLKMYFLIAGYNTMSEQEKKKYNIKKIATLFRNVLFGMAIVLIIGYFLMVWLQNPKIEFIAVLAAICGGVPTLLILANSKGYRNNNELE